MSDQFGTPGEITPVPTDDGRRRRRLILWVAVGLVVAIVIALVVFWNVRGAEPTVEPTATATPSATPTPTVTPTASPTAVPSPTPTVDDPEAIVLPEACSEVYSQAFYDSLNVPELPLNHASVAESPISRSESVEAVRAELPQLRCTWGAASETGILSAVNIVDEADHQVALATLTAEGYVCDEWLGGTHCTIELLDESGTFAAAGESHYLRGNGWVSSYWTYIDFTGYTEDAVTTLWA